ncbi:nuclear shuttle protein [West African Asystasia virus 1]|uniref:Nuclear shuttle protein n=1 Tax=West African Asystasia virus 1 TaxID=1046573 RepID=G9CM29_9GEMI|nr:nuclear shuttle protein [West African Asystasia virus 1]AEI91434.1 nuclear shuttle protein [West African Asystasia virus 1]ALQ10797.1 BV1 [West African Asystasia virus 1]
MYSTKKRYSTPYKNTLLKRPYRRTPSRMHIRPPVNRALTFEQPKKTYVSRSLEDIHSVKEMSNQADFTTFVSFPPLSHDGTTGRSFDHIKLLSLRISGTLQIKHVSQDPMDASNAFEGIFICSVLLDKRPFLADGVNSLPVFQELFGAYECVYGTPRIKANVAHRFRLLGSVKKYVSGDGTRSQLPFSFRRRISTRRYPIWSSFKDPEPNQTGGNYRNVVKNALIVNYAWVSLNSSKCTLYGQNVLHYVG